MSGPARSVVRRAVAPLQQPRLYADLLSEMERRRAAANSILVRGMIMVRDPR